VNERSVWVVLDAFFTTAPVFRLAHSVWSVALQQPLVQVITRAKKNYVEYSAQTAGEAWTATPLRDEAGVVGSL
jgi:hypothetical protein